uniref:Uncharacterized protein n=1 Tax=Sphaerodactylus townsendi TaxID=933632 RepID=A0ACB8G513_9SAUR
MEELGSYTDQLIHMAKALSVEYVHEVLWRVGPMLDIIEVADTLQVKLPVVDGFIHIASDIWEKPAVGSPSSHKMENLHKIHAPYADFFYHHPSPNSPVVKVVPAKPKSSLVMVPLNKENRK